MSCPGRLATATEVKTVTICTASAVCVKSTGRIRFLNKRIESAEVVDPDSRPPTDQIFFGATVLYCDQKGEEHKIRIVGIDEADANHGDVSWISPIARVFLKAREGDEVKLPTPATVTHPAGVETLEILEVTYTSRQPR